MTEACSPFLAVGRLVYQLDTLLVHWNQSYAAATLMCIAESALASVLQSHAAGQND